MERSPSRTDRKRKFIEVDESNMVSNSSDETERTCLEELLIDVELLGIQYRDTWHTPERTNDMKEFARKCWLSLEQDTKAVRCHAIEHWEPCDVYDFTTEIDGMDFGYRMYHMVSDVEDEETEVKVKKEDGEYWHQNKTKLKCSQSHQKKPKKVPASKAQECREPPSTLTTSTKTTKPAGLPAKRRKVDAQKTVAKEIEQTHTPAEPAEKKADIEQKAVKPHVPAAPAVKATKGAERAHNAMKPHAPAAPAAKATQRKNTDRPSGVRKALVPTKVQLKGPAPSSIKPQYWVTKSPKAVEPKAKQSSLGNKTSTHSETRANKPELDELQHKKLETQVLGSNKTESNKPKVTNMDSAKPVLQEGHKQAGFQTPSSSAPTRSALVKQPTLLRRTVKRPPTVLRPIPRTKPKAQQPQRPW